MTSFDRAADIYDQTRGLPPEVSRQVGQAFLQLTNLPTRARVLELGVGTGRIALPILDLAPTLMYAGIDLSRSMMDHLRSKTNLTPDLIQGDAVTLPFADSSFEAIVTVHILHLIRPWQSALKEMQRVRSKQGVFVGGWNDHDDDSTSERINRKFRELAAEHGISLARQGLEHYHEILPHLPESAVATEVVAAEWTVHRAPRFALQSIEERHFSSSWQVPDELYPILVQEIFAWAKHEWLDLDQPHPEVRRFKWLKVQF
jgi:SAM-dependent methyltransferase